MNQVYQVPTVIDLGVIQPDMSLKTYSFDIPIPSKDYLICRSLMIGKKDELLAKTKEGQGTHPHGLSGGHTGHTATEPTSGAEGEHTHPDTEGEHVHDVLIPESMRTLKPGDTVLVAWVGNDAVVIDIVMTLL